MEIVFTDQVKVADACLKANLNNGRMCPLYTGLDAIWDGINLARHFVVAAIENGEYIGCATYARRNGSIMIFVKEDYRRKGIGTQLIKALEEAVGVARDKYFVMSDEQFEAFFVYNGITNHQNTAKFSSPESGYVSNFKHITLNKDIRKNTRKIRHLYLDSINRKRK